jgi:hypothetical protein
MKRVLVIPINSGLDLEPVKVLGDNYIQINDCSETIKLAVTPESAKLDFN